MTDPTTPVSHTYAAFFPDQESAETCADRSCSGSAPPV